MELNFSVLEQMLSYYRNDEDVIEMINDAAESFERYHAAIIRLEIQKKLYAHGAMTAEVYREQIPELDKARTRAHNAVISNLSILNRIATNAGLPLLYEGKVSEERPFRREVADAVLAFLESIIESRS